MQIPAQTLRNRLGAAAPLNGNVAALRQSEAIDNRAYQQLKHRIHQTLLDRVDLESMQRLTQDQIRDELKILVERLLDENGGHQRQRATQPDARHPV